MEVSFVQYAVQYSFDLSLIQMLFMLFTRHFTDVHTKIMHVLANNVQNTFVKNLLPCYCCEDCHLVHVKCDSMSGVTHVDLCRYVQTRLHRYRYGSHIISMVQSLATSCGTCGFRLDYINLFENVRFLLLSQNTLIIQND